MLTREEVMAELHALADEGYRVFQSRLLADDGIVVLGVRMPALRALARRWRGEWGSVLALPDRCYEVTTLKLLVCAQQPWERFRILVDDVVPLIDNWASCDCFQPRAVREHRAEFLPYLHRYLSEGGFSARFALVTLLQSYLQREYLPLIFESAAQADAGQYYVMMGAAWLIAEVLAHFYEEGIAFLRSGRLPEPTLRRAVRKACESYRMTAAQKGELRLLLHNIPKSG